MIAASSKWFGWLAKHATTVFFTVWGAGVGAFGAILFRFVDVGPEALRIYMAVLTVLMGGAFGLLTARVSDLRTDNRAVRRKALVTLAQLTEIIIGLEVVRKAVEDLPESAELPPFEELITRQEYKKIGVAAERCYRAATAKIDFESLIERPNEIDQLVTIRRVCDNIRTICMSDDIRSLNKHMVIGLMQNCISVGRSELIGNLIADASKGFEFISQKHGFGPLPKIDDIK